MNTNSTLASSLHRAALAALARSALRARAGAGQNSIEAFDVSAAGRQDRGAHHHQGAAAQRAAELRGRQPAAHRASISPTPSTRSAAQPGHRRGRAAQHERGPGARPHAPGAQPAPPGGARDRARRPHRADHAGRAGGRRSRARRPGGALRRGAAADAKHALRDVDFRRGRGGEGRVVVDLSDSTTGIDIRQQGQQHRRRLPQDRRCRDNCARRLDVADFGTPVQTVDTFQQGENARMVIEPQGPVGAHRLPDRHAVHRRGEAGRGRPDARAGQRGRYTGEKLSLNFQNVEVRAVLQVIADFTGLNIITSDTVQRQPHAAPEGRALGPGARHHPADQGPRHAQERQRDLDRAARRARARARSSRSRRRRRSPSSSRCAPRRSS